MQGIQKDVDFFLSDIWYRGHYDKIYMECLCECFFHTTYTAHHSRHTALQKRQIQCPKSHYRDMVYIPLLVVILHTQGDLC